MKASQRLDHAEDGIWGREDKAEALDQISMEYEKSFKTQERNTEFQMWETLKNTEPTTDSVESQGNGTAQSFSELTEENSPTLRKTCLYR